METEVAGLCARGQRADCGRGEAHSSRLRPLISDSKAGTLGFRQSEILTHTSGHRRRQQKSVRFRRLLISDLKAGQELITKSLKSARRNGAGIPVASGKILKMLNADAIRRGRCQTIQAICGLSSAATTCCSECRSEIHLRFKIFDFRLVKSGALWFQFEANRKSQICQLRPDENHLRFKFSISDSRVSPYQPTSHSGQHLVQSEIENQKS